MTSDDPLLPLGTPFKIDICFDFDGEPIMGQSEEAKFMNPDLYADD
jgi:hypothetical protein